MQSNEFNNLKAFISASAFYCAWTPLACLFLLFWSDADVAALTVTAAVFFAVACCIVFVRYFYFSRLANYYSKKRFLTEASLNAAVLTLSLVWHITVRSNIMGDAVVRIFQDYAAPFLLAAVYGVLAVAILSTKKAVYFVGVEKQKNSPDAKRKVQPYLAEYASPVERARYYNKGILLELYPTIFLLSLCGRTLFGIIPASAYAVYYSIANFKRIFNTDYSKRKKIILYCVDTAAVFAALIFSLFVSDGSVFTVQFKLARGESASFYSNFILLYAALLFTVPAVVLRRVLKKRFAVLTAAAPITAAPAPENSGQV
ncbi:MAG: hypothetical protein LBP26_00350 [Clostridiales bacterium]|jgi:hypothetical protein|nr:hypothetical protein [Clostridiales bacterium]